MTITDDDVVGQMRALVDRRQLDELVCGSLRAIDLGDWDLVRPGLHPDAKFDFSRHQAATGHEGMAGEVGVEEWLGSLGTLLPGFDSYQHFVTNIVHTLDGDAAQTNCYVYATHFLNNSTGDRNITVGGSHDLSSVRTSTGWQIVHWKLTPVWYQGNPGLYRQAAEAVARQTAS
jgi:hypothetical protein